MINVFHLNPFLPSVSSLLTQTACQAERALPPAHNRDIWKRDLLWYRHFSFLDAAAKSGCPQTCYFLPPGNRLKALFYATGDQSAPRCPPMQNIHVQELLDAAAPRFHAAPAEQQAWTKGFKGEGSALLHLQTTASLCVGVCPSCCCPGAPMSERLSCLGVLPWVGSTDTSLGFPQRPQPSPSCCLGTLCLVGRACWACSGNSRFGAALAPC